METRAPHYLLFSIDAESDAPDWKGHDHEQLTFRNCEGLPHLSKFAADFGVRPTFLVSHAMAGQRALLENIGPLLKQNLCEVGSHFHPGDTPPFTDISGKDNILRFRTDVLEEKFKNLHEKIASLFGRPRSFRSGAWTIDRRIIQFLLDYGYTVDSSVTPSISWRLIGRPDYLTAPQSAYFLDYTDPSKSGDSPILEIPVTIWSPAKRDGPLGAFQGALFTMPMESRTGIIYQSINMVRAYRPLWLRPAFTPLDDMIYISENVFHETDYIHVMCHSNELTLGASPYSNTPEKLNVILTRLKLIFSYAREKGYIPLTLSEYARVNKTAPPAGPASGAIRHDSWGSQGVLGKPFPVRSAHNKRSADIFSGAFKVIVSIAILAVICLKIDFALLWSKLLVVNVSLLLAAVLLTILTHFINAWKVTLIAPAGKLTIGKMANINFMSTYLNNLLPTRLGGDVARVYYIGKELSSQEAGLYTIIFDRLSGLYIQTVIVLVSGAVFSGASIGAATKSYCLALAIAVLLLGYGMLVFAWKWVYAGKRVRLPFLNTLFDRAGADAFFKGLFEKKRRHFCIHLAGYTFQCFVIFTVMILTHALGGAISFFEASVVLFLSTVACFLPLSIGGWGVMEGVFAYMYHILRAGAGVGLAVSLGLRITSLIPSLIGGIVFMKKSRSTV
jgi:uncharacterized protein (TIRG00374 family)